jgi:UDP:flavonoid glycosyltransferase YjiC (YdhE family)
MMESLPPAQIRPFAFSEWFVRTEVPPRLAGLHAAVEDFRPDVVVHDMAELAAPIVARAHGIPYATHSFGPILPSEVAALAGEAAAPLWMQQGLEPHPRAGLYGDVYLDICPPSLQGPGIDGADRVQRVRPLLAENMQDSVPWLDRVSDRPVVYVTLGTVFNRNAGVFRTLLAGVCEQEVDVITTVGRDADPAILGPQPPNVRVEQFVDQRLVLPHCRLAVVHGGAGSTFGALAFGVALLIAPQSADHFSNAKRVVAAGAGLAINPDELTADAVSAAVSRLVGEDSFTTAARTVAAEFANMPPPAAVRAVLARLATGL